jgi:hypothetical protein
VIPTNPRLNTENVLFSCGEIQKDEHLFELGTLALPLTRRQEPPASSSASDMSEKTDFFNKDFDTLAEEASSFYHCPGLSIGIIHKGKTYAKV